MTTHRKHIRSKIKAEIALKALEQSSNIEEIAAEYHVKVHEVEQWRDRIRAGAPDLFHDDVSKRKSRKQQEKDSQLKKRLIYITVVIVIVSGIVKVAIHLAMSGGS